MENKYKHSKIYKLQCDDGHYYFGSTVQQLSSRLGGHKRNSEKKQKRGLYSHIIDIGWNHVKIILVSEHNLENKEQLLREEDRLIKEHRDDPFCLNQKRAYLTEDEHKELNKECKKKWNSNNKYYMKEYRTENKEKLSEQKKDWYNKNKDKILEHRKSNYYDNKDRILESQRKYYNDNFDVIKEKKKEHYKKMRDDLLKPYKCECGSEIVVSCKLRHERSKKHILYINKINTATGEIIASSP